jgi:uncharacterized protein (DUF433 family)
MMEQQGGAPASTTIQTTPAPINHIGIDERGIARIAGHRMRVIDVVWDTRAGMSPREIFAEHPGLTMAQIHAAMAYYYDHQAELDATMERQQREAQEEWAKQQASNDPLLQRLRALKVQRMGGARG